MHAKLVMVAQCSAVSVCANGKGVQQNYRESHKWFLKAAEGGHALAAESAKNGRSAPRPAAVTAPPQAK